MIFGLPWSIPFGTHDAMLKIFNRQDFGDGRGARLTLKPASGYGEMYWAVVCDGVAQTVIFLPENETKQATVTYNPDLSSHAVSAVPLGKWEGIPPSVNVAVQQNLFEESRGTFAELVWNAYDYLECVSTDGQLSGWNLTGFQRFKNIRPVMNFPTRGELDVVISTSGSTHTVKLQLNGYVIASGSRTGDGQVTLSQQNSSGVSGTVQLAYSADIALGSNYLQVRYPKKYRLYVNSTYNKTVNDNGISNAYVSRLGPLSAGSHNLQIQAVSDTEVQGTIGTALSQSIPGRPNPPSSLAYSSGDYTNTVVSWTLSNTPNASYRIYDSVINGPTLFGSVAKTAIHGATQVQLDSLSSASAGIRRVVIESLNISGIESGYRPELKIEYDSSGNVISNRPNVPGYIYGNIQSGNRLYVDWSYSKHEEQVPAAKMQLFLCTSGSSPNFSSPSSEQWITGNGNIRNGTISGVVSTNGFINYAVRSVTLSGIQSLNTVLQGPIWISSNILSGTTGTGIVVT